MTDFFEPKAGKLDLKGAAISGNGFVNAASNGPANVKTPKGDTKVGAMGDNVANNKVNDGAFNGSEKVGAMGDSAAKKGTGA